MKKEMLRIIPNDNKVLIKVSKSAWNSLFSKYVRIADGKEVELFTDIKEDDGYEKRFSQNVSVGVVIAVGRDVSGVLKGDMAIIDYAVTGNDDALVGFVNGDRIVAIDAQTTYHTTDSAPQMNGRHAYVKGDVDNLSKLLGVVRMRKVIAFSPYVFLMHEDARKLKVSSGGVMVEEVDEVCTRRVLASPSDSVCAEGDSVLINEIDLFGRVIDGKEVSVIFETDIMGVK